MNSLKKVGMVLALSTCSALVNASGYHENEYAKAEYNKHVDMLWFLGGVKNTYECEIPITDQGTVTASCHDHDIVNLRTQQVIGTATDATADAVQIGDAVVATGTTFFRVPQGELVIRGRGTIQPIVAGNPNLNGTPITHIAGIFPEPGANNVLSGTGVFEGAEGTFSLLGALDLANLSSGQAAFNCIYKFDLVLKAPLKKRAGRPFRNPRLN